MLTKSRRFYFSLFVTLLVLLRSSCYLLLNRSCFSFFPLVPASHFGSDEQVPTIWIKTTRTQRLSSALDIQLYRLWKYSILKSLLMYMCNHFMACNFWTNDQSNPTNKKLTNKKLINKKLINKKIYPTVPMFSQRNVFPTKIPNQIHASFIF